MPTTEVKGSDLLEVVKQMAPDEFDAFIEQALTVRRRTKPNRLSAQETKLIKRISRGLTLDFSKRYAFLMRRRKTGRLTAAEHQELLKLTHEAESQDAERAAALLELANVRRLPVRTLMKQMGIGAPTSHA